MYLLVALALTQLAYAKVDLLTSVTAQKNSLRITINEEFKKKYLNGDFFADYDSDINLEQFDYSVLSLPCIMNLISLVWISGKTYYIEEMDTELFDSLARVKEVFKCLYPNTLWDGQLIPRTLKQHTYTFHGSDHTALLYSGGLDSTSTAFAHLNKKQLLITAWGHWDIPLAERGLWQARRSKIEAFAHEWGNETSFIKSNYSSFLKWEYLATLTPEIKKWRLGAVEGLGWAGLTLPVLLSKGYQTLRIASSHTWAYPYPSAANPCIDNNLALCGVQVIHDQFDKTRLQKIAFIDTVCHERSIEPPFLKVCPLEKKQDRNCCNCRKCLSTIAGFLCLGIDPKPYGLSCKQALDRICTLLKPQKLNYYTIELFTEAQELLHERIKRGEDIGEIEKILEIDLSKKKPFDIIHQSTFDWDKLKSLCPSIGLS